MPHRPPTTQHFGLSEAPASVRPARLRAARQSNVAEPSRAADEPNRSRAEPQLSPVVTAQVDDDPVGGGTHMLHRRADVYATPLESWVGTRVVMVRMRIEMGRGQNTCGEPSFGRANAACAMGGSPRAQRKVPSHFPPPC